MTTPKRIRRQRTKGWRLPDNTITVTRPTPWGNPFPVQPLGRDEAVRLHQAWLDNQWERKMYPWSGEHERRFGKPSKRLIKLMLSGKDLACWCKLCDKHQDGKPFDVDCPDCEACHADELGRLANGLED